MKNSDDFEARRGYQQAKILAVEHYENFPVISRLIPKHLRNDIAIIYWFARTADDIADEEENDSHDRIKVLKKFQSRFENTLEGNFQEDFDTALAHTIRTRNLSPQYFFDLLSAFNQDIDKHRYADVDDLLDYCRRSANPVGRLLLELYQIKNEEAIKSSDALCTALQLANFWQDVSVDILNDRIYIPEELLRKYSITPDQIGNKQFTSGFKQCMIELCDHTESFFREGEKLLTFLPFRFRVEIAATIAGGRKILVKIKKNDYNTVSNRVRLSFFDISVIFIKSIYYATGIRSDHRQRKQK